MPAGEAGSRGARGIAGMVRACLAPGATVISSLREKGAWDGAVEGVCEYMCVPRLRRW